ncbi:OLC1v1003953C1 [Oldenlandia corymbosa var. corymbosa]|uniref:Protein disulfide-isomerase n=1 Tax=Oldenlandia corymbosa var. corymbosa TaxID=529605 RepID=A0AAV1DDI2_OLDCO|nr:OLC1v1003953C1 [Oldenlandia corymbosa var. corymbosa]
MPSRLILLLSLSSLLLLSIIVTPAVCKTSAAAVDDDDEDLSFLEDGDDEAADHSSPHHYGGEDDFSDQEESYDDDDFEVPSNFDHGDGGNEDEVGFNSGVDEKDVVVLKEGNFSDFIESNKYVMVEFYAPWCGHCQSLAPEYAAAATELKAGAGNEKVALAKVDATEENELAEQYEVQGFPTVLFFIDGEHKPYNGQRSKDAIVTWIKKKIGPGVANITTLDDAERILTSEDKVVLGFLNSLVGPESDELAAASKLDDAVNFYQTVSPDVAKLFHLEPNAKRPAVVLLKKVAEKVTTFDGEFTKSAIVEFVSANKLPLVTTFTRESAPQIFESPINKQLLLFAKSSDSEKFLPTYQEVAKLFKGKLIFVYVEMDNEDTGKPVAEYFGVDGDGPKVIAFAANDEGKKYILDKEFTLDNIKVFASDFLEDKLKPFYKSDPIPEMNDGDVKIVVGNNFDEIVLDDSKDVLLEVNSPTIHDLIFFFFGN